ncbi:hypothetical protein ACIP5Y_28385 [Nocardia sp. NPDC088792]|uniref:hypothetical protein n=1 Tax=Nocardia sp. NPDC088792 TaxID=3364332 RepID=UPI00381D2ED0
MTTRRNTSTSLSDTDIQRIAAEVEAGRSPRVWFTADAVGIDEGRSGKVVAVADPTEPDYLHVLPTGSDDALAFSPDELSITRPPRRQHTTHKQHHHADTTSPSLFDDFDGHNRVAERP